MSHARAAGRTLATLAGAVALVAGALGSGPPPSRPRPIDPAVVRSDVRLNRALPAAEPGKTSDIPMPKAAGRTAPGTAQAAAPVPSPAPAALLPTGFTVPAVDPQQAVRSVQTVGLFALVSLAPAAVLMVTAFVRINIVLVLLRQALGSPQVPGNQVLTALALLLTALVMRPVGEQVYARAIGPFAEGRLSWSAAYREATGPVKAWMVGQIEATRHERYLWDLYDLAVPPAPGRADPVYGDDFPMRVVAPAFLLSELTTALVIGFYLYLPFLVIDLVVSAVLAAMGMFMLPPSLVALPLKLILFVLADGWLLVATMLLQSFGMGASP
jgi:flagellar biosynthetic protein FliP